VDGATLKKGHWFDSDLSILEPVNSIQMVVFEQLKMTGLLCSREEILHLGRKINGAAQREGR
jgi:hypothetical protein